MRTLILGIVCSVSFLCSQSAHAQENCKYNVDKKDPFTEKAVRAIITPLKFVIFPAFNWQLFLYKEGDSYHLETSVAFVGEIHDVLQKGDSLQFKFENGKIFTAYARDQIIPLVSGSDSRVTAYQNIYFPVTADEFTLFTASPVSFVQMNAGVRKFQEKVNEKNAKKIVNAALCVMK